MPMNLSRKYDAVLFDLDGTLLDIDDKAFESIYMGSLTQYFNDLIKPDELLQALWLATRAMIEDCDETQTNESVFYRVFERQVGTEAFQKLVEQFDNFYETDYRQLKNVSQPSDHMVDSVRFLTQQNIPMIIATNPMFPHIATSQRVAWAGLSDQDFLEVTTFESHSFCKPNPNYYRSILDRYGFDPTRCLMIGNDVQEDVNPARALGMDAWLIEDNLIDRDGKIECEWRGKRSELLNKLKGAF